MFLVPKKDSKQRSVINFKRLNQSVKAEHFQMEGIHMLKKQSRRLDGKKDAYFMILIAQKFSSRSNGRTRHTIGWFSASWFFTKTTRPVGAALQEIRLHLIIFIDGIFVMAETESLLKDHISVVVYLCIYIIYICYQPPKSVFTPTQEIKISAAIPRTIKFPGNKINKSEPRQPKVATGLNVSSSTLPTDSKNIFSRVGYT